jgi:predicted DNA-binding transcriptional regulator AlpA
MNINLLIEASFTVAAGITHNCPSVHWNAHMGKKHRLRAVMSSDIATAVINEQLAGLDRVVSEAQTAEILGVSKDTLRREVNAGRGPPRVRMSDRRIGYRLSEIYKLIEARTERPGER